VNGERELLRKAGVVFKGKLNFVDAGANVGDWTNEAILSTSDYKGHLFEISSSNVESLKRRFRSDENLLINRVALSDTTGTLHYQDYGDKHKWNTTIVSTEYHKKNFELKSASAITGDEYCQIHGIDQINLLKIDVEGAEYSVLQGFTRMLASQSVDIIQFEYGYISGDAHTLMRDFFLFFEKFGYSIGPLRKNGVQFKNFDYQDNEFKSGPNYVAATEQYIAPLRHF
jgi:FkbM family methyltransferase